MQEVTNRGEEVRLLRRMSGLTLEAAASELGIAASYLGNMELGYRRVPDEIMGRAREVLILAAKKEVRRVYGEVVVA